MKIRATGQGLILFSKRPKLVVVSVMMLRLSVCLSVYVCCRSVGQLLTNIHTC